ncbi:MAG: thiamine-phosphate kinase [Gemmatimonadales bacterium]
MTAISLGGGIEFDRIRAIAAALGDAAAGLGDDAGVIPRGDGTPVISVDVSVERVHFRTEWLAFDEIGWRACAAALSDLAATAATPAAVLATVVVAPNSGETALVDLMRGVGAAAASVGASVIGGDLSSGSDWVIAITVIGHARRPMSRAGARPGDGIWVTGQLGGAGAALAAWQAGSEPDAAARAAFAHPVPRIGAARWLAGHNATAMLDLSDGLGGDGAHLAAASHVGVHLELDTLPMHPSMLHAAAQAAHAPQLMAASAGEDYELLVTLPREFDAAEDFTAAADLPLTRIGTVTDGRGVDATLGGHAQPLRGFEHRL